MMPVRLTLIACLAVLPSGALAAQQVSPAVLKEIQAVEAEWAKAYQTHDARILDRILGSEYYIFSAWDGKTYRKADEIRDTGSSKANYASITNTVLDARQYGDVVVALGRYDEKEKKNGKIVEAHGTWQTVFSKRNGQWVAIASHAAPVPKR